MYGYTLDAYWCYILSVVLYFILLFILFYLYGLYFEFIYPNYINAEYSVLRCSRKKKHKKGPTIFEYKESKVEYKDCKSLQDAFQNYPIYIRRVKLSSTSCKLRKISKPNQKPFSERINSSCRANNSFACKVNFKD